MKEEDTGLANIKVDFQIRHTRVEGPGLRYAIWVHEPSSPIRSTVDAHHNDDSHLFQVSAEVIAHEVVNAGVQGITILGGEPFDQASELADLARLVHAHGLTVMLYSRYRLSELRSRALNDRGVRLLLSHTDLLVSGSLGQWAPDQARRWVGSVNQQLHFLSDAYTPESQVWSISHEVPHQREIRIYDHHATHQTILTNGWPHHFPNQQIVESSFTLKLSQALGLQWLDELFHRETLTINSSQDWHHDTAYWSLAFDRARKRCLYWVLEMSHGVRLPRLIHGRLLEVNILDLDPDLHPLRFGPETEALLSGPDAWRTSLKHSWETKSTTPDSKLIRWFTPHEPQVIYLGDWLLLASFWSKLKQDQITAQLCQELMQRPRNERNKIRAWFFHTSPLCALLDLSEGIPWLMSYPQNDLPAQMDHVFSLISPGLSHFWFNQVSHEHTSQEHFTGDGWHALHSIAILNQWAAEMRYFSLGEACITTVSRALMGIAPDSFFKGTAPSIEHLSIERARRHQICNISLPWQPIIERAQQVRYGEEDYLQAQLTLRYSSRWRSMFDSLQELTQYAKRLVNASSE